jgi:hypothetical protein
MSHKKYPFYCTSHVVRPYEQAFIICNNPCCSSSGFSAAVHCLVWHMTWRKRAAVGFKNNPLVRVLTRDGGIVGAGLAREYKVVTPL